MLGYIKALPTKMCHLCDAISLHMNVSYGSSLHSSKGRSSFIIESQKQAQNIATLRCNREVTSMNQGHIIVISVSRKIIEPGLSVPEWLKIYYNVSISVFVALLLVTDTPEAAE